MRVAHYTLVAALLPAGSVPVALGAQQRAQEPADHPPASAHAIASAVADDQLNRLAKAPSSAATTDADDRAANAEVVRDVRNWMDRRIAPPRPTVIELPPGTPIG